MLFNTNASGSTSGFGSGSSFGSAFGEDVSTEAVDAVKEIRTLAALTSVFTVALLQLENVDEEMSLRKLISIRNSMRAYAQHGHSVPTKALVIDDLERRYRVALEAAGVELYSATVQKGTIVPSAKYGYAPMPEDADFSTILHELRYHGKILPEVMMANICGLSAESALTFASAYFCAPVSGSNILSLKVADGDAGRFSEVTFDFANLEIRTNRTFKVRKNVFIKAVGVVAPETLMVLLAMQLHGPSGYLALEDVAGTMAYLTAAFQADESYGWEMPADSALSVVRDNTVALIQFEESGTAPFFRLSNSCGPNTVRECVNYYLDRKIPAFTDKYAVKAVVVKDGVHALGLGFDWEAGVIVTPFDAGKASKFFNRPWQGVATMAETATLEKAALSIRGAEGDIAMYGDKVDTFAHNGHFLNNGSGVAVTNRNFTPFIKKTIRGEFSSLFLQKNQTLMQVELMAAAALSELIRGGVVPEDNVFLRLNGVEVLRFTGKNQPLSLEGAEFEITRNSRGDALSIKLSVRYIFTSSQVKMRGIGTKALLKQGSADYSISLDGESVDFGVSLNTETQKGVTARLHLYAEHLMTLTGRGSVYLPNEGVLLCPVGSDSEVERVDLDDLNSSIYKWVAAEMSKDYVISDVVGVEYYRKVCSALEGGQAYLTDRAGARVETIEEALTPDGLGVYVSETVQGVRSRYPFAVEVSTPREATSRQNMTFEGLAVAYTQYPKLAEGPVKELNASSSLIDGFIAMVANNPNLIID